MNLQRMNKKHFFLVLFLFAQGYLMAQSALLQNIQGRKIQSLNGRWNYIIDPYEMGYYDYRHEPFDQSKSGRGGFYDDRNPKDKTELIEYNFDLSPTLDVPGDWNSQADKLSLYEGTIWYRQKFNSEALADKKYLLYFAAVNYEAHVYLNGKKLGVHKGGFTPFQFDVTGKLNKGENFVVVKVDNMRKQDEIPTVNTDWWNYGGITRDVYLAELPTSYISDYKIQLAKANPKLIEGYVQLAGASKQQTVTVKIAGANLSATVTTDSSGRAAFAIPVKNITYWSPEDPKLYEVSIASNTDAVTDRIGFRTIEVKGQDIILNGKSIYLRGISIHDENPLIPGRLRGAGDIKMMLSWAKELNCNYVRLAHYTHNEEMVRMADEMGLLVWAEVPVYWTISWENAATYNNAAQQVKDNVTRDKNRASVIIWSIGNETPLSEPRHKFMGNLASLVRELDNTRLLAAALELHRKGNEVIVDDPLGEKLDLVSFNEYAGWYWGGTPKEITKYTFNIKYKKPVIISEFGGEALEGYHGDENTRWTEEWQEAMYVNQIKMLSTIEGLRGMTPWILVDFRSPRRQHPYFQDFWNRKGVFSALGKKKKAFYVLKNYYDQMQAKYQ
ncbi:MAG TPA: glycoside hydrolase family 2 TIM barrel-domain containing protein [Flavisolibacter sp.]|nr:glycoside hydrolase family 2 TIM barrel-domain containing protein [Flavisolibacter sp.]